MDSTSTIFFFQAITSPELPPHCRDASSAVFAASAQWRPLHSAPDLYIIPAQFKSLYRHFYSTCESSQVLAKVVLSFLFFFKKISSFIG